MMEYKTESGSTYQSRSTEMHDGTVMTEVRRVVRSELSTAERVSEDWKTVESLEWHGVGHSLVMWWGFEQDEYSVKAVQRGAPVDGGTVVRCTETTRVVSVNCLS